MLGPISGFFALLGTLVLQGSAKAFGSRSELRQALESWTFDAASRLQLKNAWGPIWDWDVSAVRDMRGLFQDLSSFDEEIQYWNTSQVTDMSRMFYGARAFNHPIEAWDTSAVLDMSHMFHGASSFDRPIGAWNTAAVKDMSHMFRGASQFNQPIGAWDTNSVTDMSYMFGSASQFNQQIGTWNTSAVKDMRHMFHGASKFNESIAAWATDAVTDMSYMFCFADDFNQPIGAWNTSSVTSMAGMFGGAVHFNQPIGSWNTSSVMDMSRMFIYAVAFNQALSAWITSAVQDMSLMFADAVTFNHAISTWDTSSVTNMSYMFASAKCYDGLFSQLPLSITSPWADGETFNQPIGTWNTSAVTDMSYMFYGLDPWLDRWSYRYRRCIDLSPLSFEVPSWFGSYSPSLFNKQIGGWNTSAVTNMSHMFHRAIAFNQAIGAWDTSAVKDMSKMFTGATSFNQLLHTWDVDQARGAEAIMDQAAFSEAAKCAMWQSWRPPSGVPKSGGAACPGCHLRDCPTDDLVCIQGTCKPLSEGFIQLGKAQWAQPLSSSSATREGCRDTCQSWTNCSGYVLQVDSCVLLHDSGFPDKQNDTGQSMAFAKIQCSTFACPVGSNRSEAPGDPVTAASCCACLPHLVEDPRVKAPALACTCPPHQYANHSVQNGERTVQCHSCGPGYELNPSGWGAPCKKIKKLKCRSGTHSTGATCTACPAFSKWSGAGCAFDWVLSLIVLAAVFSVVAVLTTVRRKHMRQKELQQQREQSERAVRQLRLQEEGLQRAQRVEARNQQELTELREAQAESLRVELEQRAQRSLLAGVSMRYLLSEDFTQLARDRARSDDPTFNDLKEAFWLGEAPIGEDVLCPRDRRPGCALVDWIAEADAPPQTHFMSWTWRYRLSQVQNALEMYQKQATNATMFPNIAFFMCFFVNNQFRVILEESSCDNLDTVFRQNLMRCGQMVAVLDTWEQPVYLSRVWTIYEQFVASSIDIPVTFVMPEAAGASLQEQIMRGEVGITKITSSISMLDVAKAEAWKQEDEIKVKAAIQDSVGFDRVNKHVAQVMVQWIGEVVKDHFQQHLQAGEIHRTAEASDRHQRTVPGFYSDIVFRSVGGSSLATGSRIMLAKILSNVGEVAMGIGDSFFLEDSKEDSMRRNGVSDADRILETCTKKRRYELHVTALGPMKPLAGWQARDYLALALRVECTKDSTTNGSLVRQDSPSAFPTWSRDFVACASEAQWDVLSQLHRETDVCQAFHCSAAHSRVSTVMLLADDGKGQFIGKALTCLEEARGQATELDDMSEVYWEAVPDEGDEEVELNFPDNLEDEKARMKKKKFGPQVDNAGELLEQIRSSIKHKVSVAPSSIPSNWESAMGCGASTTSPAPAKTEAWRAAVPPPEEICDFDEKPRRAKAKRAAKVVNFDFAEQDASDLFAVLTTAGGTSISCSTSRDQ
ncbi:hypothetical protein AK812_SmicGene11235 [Symbiodinium microadriaticum]|uniref:Uncharacterized protein n=1 Tax=Symbiodinium microadriaticum TaxID=2951 RepID=A0A1Q9EDQ5_SYMMI|nr:hypothetical protein AK812_SmicGene11235 [Symbiodinium microadriaticum]